MRWGLRALMRKLDDTRAVLRSGRAVGLLVVVCWESFGSQGRG